MRGQRGDGHGGNGGDVLKNYTSSKTRSGLGAASMPQDTREVFSTTDPCTEVLGQQAADGYPCGR